MVKGGRPRVKWQQIWFLSRVKKKSCISKMPVWFTIGSVAIKCQDQVRALDLSSNSRLGGCVQQLWSPTLGPMTWARKAGISSAGNWMCHSADILIASLANPEQQCVVWGRKVRQWCPIRILQKVLPLPKLWVCNPHVVSVWVGSVCILTSLVAVVALSEEPQWGKAAPPFTSALLIQRHHTACQLWELPNWLLQKLLSLDLSFPFTL